MLLDRKDGTGAEARVYRGKRLRVTSLPIRNITSGNLAKGGAARGGPSGCGSALDARRDRSDVVVAGHRVPRPLDRRDRAERDLADGCVVGRERVVEVERDRPVRAPDGHGL